MPFPGGRFRDGWLAVSTAAVVTMERVNTLIIVKVCENVNYQWGARSCVWLCMDTKAFLPFSFRGWDL